LRSTNFRVSPTRGATAFTITLGVVPAEQTVTEHFQQMLDDGLVHRRPGSH
jgi:hypothetical protein